MSSLDDSASTALPDIEEFEVAVALIQQHLVALSALFGDAAIPLACDLGYNELAFCKAAFDELDLHPEVNSDDLDIAAYRDQLEYVARLRRSCHLLEDLIKLAENPRMQASGEVLVIALEASAQLSKAGYGQNLPSLHQGSRLRGPRPAVTQLLASKRLRH